jgi:acyl carrier protein
VRALDSLAIEELIAHIEESYRIHLDEDDIVPEHFASLGALAALVDAKRRAR